MIIRKCKTKLFPHTSKDGTGSSFIRGWSRLQTRGLYIIGTYKLSIPPENQYIQIEKEALALIHGTFSFFSLEEGVGMWGIPGLTKTDFKLFTVALAL